VLIYSLNAEYKRLHGFQRVCVVCRPLFYFLFYFGSFERQANGGAEFLDLKVTLNIRSIFPLKCEMNM
jgi:hypothetical protein